MVNNMKTIFLALIILMFLGSGFAYQGKGLISIRPLADGVEGNEVEGL